jgi:hypothetical protein
MTSHVESFLWDTVAHVKIASASILFTGPNYWGRHLASDPTHELQPITHDFDQEYDDSHSSVADSHADDGHGDEHGGSVHISYEDLYASIMFFACIYVGGQLASRLLRMPSLVGEIFVGILLGPNLAAYVPNPVSFVMLGEIGLILLVLEAGIDIDLTMLKLIGTRGFIIAIIGSILPIAIAIAIAFAIGTDTAGSIAAGAAFGPTSLGIAMNILRQVGAFLSQFKRLLQWLMYISLLSGENCQHSRRTAHC